MFRCIFCWKICFCWIFGSGFSHGFLWSSSGRIKICWKFTGEKDRDDFYDMIWNCRWRYERFGIISIRVITSDWLVDTGDFIDMTVSKYRSKCSYISIRTTSICIIILLITIIKSIFSNKSWSPFTISKKDFSWTSTKWTFKSSTSPQVLGYQYNWLPFGLSGDLLP